MRSFLRKARSCGWPPGAQRRRNLDRRRAGVGCSGNKVHMFTSVLQVIVLLRVPAAANIGTDQTSLELKTEVMSVPLCKRITCISGQSSLEI